MMNIQQEAGEISGQTRVVRVQTGVRLEKRLLKVLKGVAEYKELSLGDLLEGIVLHAFEGRSPFGEETRRRIAELKQVYGMDYGAEASHRMADDGTAVPVQPVSWDDLDDGDFLEAFNQGSMARQPFRHPHHVRVAWLLLRKEPLAKVAPEVRQGIGAIAAAHRKHDLYHETITQAFLRLVAARIASGPPQEDWEGFQQRNPELLAWPSPLLSRHYSGDLLFSEAARQAFVAPDRQPLPAGE